jgi:hypothetical protein
MQLLTSKAGLAAMSELGTKPTFKCCEESPLLGVKQT